MQLTATQQVQTREARMIIHPSLSTASRTQQNFRIGLPVADGLKIIDARQIVHCQSEGNYCNIAMADGSTMLLSKTLKWLCQRLPEQLFVRTHASHLVALSCIVMLTNHDVRLESGKAIPISRQKKGEVRERILQSIIN